MIKFCKIFNQCSFSTIVKPPYPTLKPQSTILKPPSAIKRPPVPGSGMSLTILAEKLNISESALRKQMINPKSNVVSKE